MTTQESKQLIILTQRVEDMARQLDKNTADTAAIRSALDNLSGGRQALMWVAGLIVSIGVIIATIAGVHK